MIGRAHEPVGPAWVAYRAGLDAPPEPGAGHPFSGPHHLYRFTSHGGAAVRVWFERGAVSSVRVEFVGPLFPATEFRAALTMAQTIERAVHGYAVVTFGPALESTMTVSLPSRRSDEQALEDVVDRIREVLATHGADDGWVEAGWSQRVE